jgi:phosphohistidine phosphatase
MRRCEGVVGVDQDQSPVKTLYLLRHAKSSWEDAAVPDHDRPLAPRGARAAQKIAAHIAASGIHPVLVLCSSAQRTRETFDALAGSLGVDAEVQIEDGLYGAGATQLLGRLRKVPSATTSVMMIGHNPGLHDLAMALAGDGDEQALRQLRTKFPTAALATLDLEEVGWDELGPSQAYLESVVLPRHLP